MIKRNGMRMLKYVHTIAHAHTYMYAHLRRHAHARMSACTPTQHARIQYTCMYTYTHAAFIHIHVHATPSTHPCRMNDYATQGPPRVIYRQCLIKLCTRMSKIARVRHTEVNYRLRYRDSYHMIKRQFKPDTHRSTVSTTAQHAAKVSRIACISCKRCMRADGTQISWRRRSCQA